MSQPILIATYNPGKASDMAELLREAGFETVTLSELGIGDVEEVGESFEEIALLKARHYAHESGLVALADDGGLEVDALGGAPGVKSKRWVGEGASWDDLARAVVERLRGVPAEKRTARIRSVAAVAAPDGRAFTSEAAIEGRIAENLDESKVIAGYPYRALLVVDGYGKLYADLTHEEHEAINQRRKAIRALLPKLWTL